MKKLGHYFSRFIEFIFAHLPWSANRLFAKGMRFLWLDLFGIRKNIIHQNLEIAFPGMSPDKKDEIARKSVELMTRSFFDVMKIPSLRLLSEHPDQAWVRDNVVLHGDDQVRNLDEGVLFLCLHMASGDLGAALISSFVRPLALITKRFKNPFLDQFWFSLRGQSKTQFIDPHAPNNSFLLLKALKEKKGVCFVLDQFMGKPYGIRSQFFGRTTGTAYGLAMFALKTKHPVIPLHTHYGPDDKFHIHFDPPVDFSGLITENKDETILNCVNRLNQELERIIRAYPEDWMWVHRRWKSFD